MKRFISIILSLALVFVLLPDYYVQAVSPMISAEIINASPGEVVEVKLMMSDNPGIISLGLDIQYDNSKV